MPHQDIIFRSENMFSAVKNNFFFYYLTKDSHLNLKFCNENKVSRDKLVKKEILIHNIKINHL